MELPTHIVSAGAVVFNDKDEILLVKNPRKGWEFPGGIVERGETVAQGAIREVKEESGIDITIENIVGIYSSTKEKKGFNGVKVVPPIVTIDFIGHYAGGEFTTSDESDEVGWFKAEDAVKLVKRASQPLRLKNALNYKAGIYAVGYKVDEARNVTLNESYVFDR